MDKVKFNNYLYAVILIVMLVCAGLLLYIVTILKTDAVVCMMDPLSYAREQGLEFIQLKL